MCGGPQITSTTQNSTTTASATPQEQAMEQIQLGQMEQYAPAQTQMYNTAFDTGNNLLNAVNQPGSPQWATLLGGVNQQQTNSMVNTADQSLQGSLQQAGIYNSGTAATGRMKSATDVANSNAQFNVGSLQAALNLALSGQTQIQGTATNNSSQLGQELAGLRTTNTSGYGTSSVTGSGVNLGILGSWGTSYCWVAAEVFNEGMNDPNTCAARFYILNIAPTWFRKLYGRFGQGIASFIHNKPILKAILKPLFQHFVHQTRIHVKARTI